MEFRTPTTSVISIHALREESDAILFRRSALMAMISIHALREESDMLIAPSSLCSIISIHALREESDESGHGLTFYGDLFQSTLSVRRATRVVGDDRAESGISIHALREESDASRPVSAT